MSRKPKLNQIIAVAGGKKTQAEKALTEAYHKLQKSDLMAGLARSYAPKAEDGDQLPSETKNVQFTCGDAIVAARAALSELFDVVATQDNANCSAQANVVVDDHAVLENMPVTTLLFLEKKLVDIATFVSKLPVLDPAETWQFDPNSNQYASAISESFRTQKVFRNHVLSEATDKHPAQVQVYSEDVPVGKWTTRKFSGAIPAKQKAAMESRVRKLQEAVKTAREEANEVEVERINIGDDILDFVFGVQAEAKA